MIESLRAAQLFMCAVALVGLILIIGQRWRRWDSAVRLFFMGVLATVAAIGWGVAESMLAGAPGGPRSVVYVIGLGWLAWGTTVLLVQDINRRKK